MQNKFFSLGISLLIFLVTAAASPGGAHAQTSGFDIVLANNGQPIFTNQDIPQGYDNDNGGRRGNFPFANVEWLDGGFFAVAGWCASGNFTNAPLESGGLYTFKDNGSFIKSFNVCWDAHKPGPGIIAACGEIGGCQVGTKMERIPGKSEFILDTGAAGGDKRRPPLWFSVSDNNLSLRGKPYSTRGKRLSRVFAEPQQGDTVGTITGATHVAYTNNTMVSVERVYEGKRQVTERGYTQTGQTHDRFSFKTVFRALPSLNALVSFTDPEYSGDCQFASCSGVPLLNEPLFYPLVGVGDLVIAQRSTAGGVRELDVYRIPSTGALNAGAKPIRIQTLTRADARAPQGTAAFQGITVDHNSNPKRIAVNWSSAVVIYKVDAQGLSEVSTRPTLSTTGAGTPERNHFAIAGDYFVHVPRPTAPGSQTQTHLVVEKNDQPLLVEPLPRDPTGTPLRIMAVDVSPSGDILVSAEGIYFGTQAGTVHSYLYLYKNSDGQPSSSFSPGPTIPAQPFTFGTSNNFIQRIQELLNQDPETRVSSFGAGSVGEETSFFGARTLDAIQRFQVKHGIVREGEAGYGIIGPRTRAQLNALSSPSTQGGTQEDVVRSPHVRPRGTVPTPTAPPTPTTPSLTPAAAPSQTTQPTPTPEEGEEGGVMQTRLDELQDRLRDTLRQIQDLRDQLGL